MVRHNFALSAEQKSDAREAIGILGDSGITLAEAARRAVAGRRAIERITVEVAADRFLRTRITSGCRPGTVAWYDENLRIISASLGDRMLDAVTRAQFREWLESEQRAPSSKAAIARAARALWRWAIRSEPSIATDDVTTGLTFSVSPQFGFSKKVLKVETCEKIIRGVPDRHRPAIALMMFAGIRPEEICGDGKPWLPWAAVNTEEKIIRVDSEFSKVGQPRLLEGLPDAVWRWFPANPAPGRATIAHSTVRTTVEAAKRASGLKEWLQDGLRHSFASYALAFTSDAGKVSMWLGHNGSPTMLHRHYRGVVKNDDAKRFFAIKPNLG